MEIEVLEMTDRSMKFVLKNTKPELANALRRTLLSDLPKMAIDSVDFNLGPMDLDGKVGDSKSPLFDEIIAHRIGQIPIPTDYKLFNFQSECDCGGEGCPKCRIDYILNKVGPCTVMSSDLISLGDDNLAPVEPNIPITVLTEGESLSLQAYAVMGTAAKHVKWQIASGIGYRYRPKVTVKKDVTDAKAIADECPKKVFEVEGKKLVVKKEKETDCILCNACVEMSKDAIEVVGDEHEIIMNFETDGSITAQEALDKAVEILSKEAKSLASIEGL